MSSCVPADELALVLITAPSAEVAATLARPLVEEGLAACVNILPGLRSIYRWQGQLHDEAEVLCLVKTSAARLPALQARVEALHPYQVPEVLALTGSRVNETYRDWVLAATAPASPG